MTSKQSNKKAECRCENWDRIDRSIAGTDMNYHYYQCSNCYKVEYPPSEIQKLMDHADRHQFMFITDWILAWLYAGDGVPVSGITMLQKQLFIIFKEFAPENGIPSENPGFRAYRYGPYTERIDRAVDSLMSLDLIVSVGRMNTVKEVFYLTDLGMKEGESAFNKLSEGQKNELQELRRELQQFTVQGIMTYVYKKYPKCTNESVVFEKTLHRKRYDTASRPYISKDPYRILAVPPARGA